ncbi:ABC transporter permease [Luteimonas sp. MJ293]|uniref:ABC transporter permease n=1 Tax=Luteimonas sp. MJ146 TaxID=3129240 RepID=UPI0031BABD7E
MAIVARPHAFSPWRCYLLEARYELLRQLREPAFVLPTLLFPTAFYLLFGVMLSRSAANAEYMLAGYGVFGIMGAALFGFGAGIASEREQGLLRLKRALPAPPGAWLLAKMAAAMAFAAVISILLATLAATLGGVALAPWQWLVLLAINVLGVLPFCAIGLYIGSLVGANAAVAVVNILFLPMAFLSGLWMPLAVLPDIFTRLAPVWPAYHLGQAAMKVVGHDAGGSLWLHLGVLGVVTGVFFILARRRLAAAV